MNLDPDIFVTRIFVLLKYILSSIAEQICRFDIFKYYQFLSHTLVNEQYTYAIIFIILECNTEIYC